MSVRVRENNRKRGSARGGYLVCLAGLAVFVWLFALGAAGGGEMPGRGGIGRDRPRYALFDRHMTPLAVDVPVVSLFVVLREVARPARLAGELARVTGRSRRDLEALLRGGRGVVRIPGLFPPGVADGLRLPGVRALRSFRRYYPQGSLASHFIGFVIGGRGVAGAEAVFDRELSGFGSDAGNVVLSLDLGVQRALEQGLARIAGAGAGLAVGGVMDAGSGAVLAMADMPGFDANRLWRYDPAVIGNDFFRPAAMLPPVGGYAGLGAVAVLAERGHGGGSPGASPMAALVAFARQVNGGRPVAVRWKTVSWRPGRGFYAPAPVAVGEDAPAAGPFFVPAGRSGDVAYYRPAAAGDGPFVLAAYPAGAPRYVVLLGASPAAADRLRALAAQVLRRAGTSAPDLRPPAAARMDAVRRAGTSVFVAAGAGGAAPGAAQEAKKTPMPDLVGMSLRRALRRLQPLAVRIRVAGSGRVVAQRPRPGRAVAAGDEAVIRLEAGT